MEVREVGDPQAVELLRQAGQRNPALGQPHPTCLEVPPGSHAGRGRERYEPERGQTCSFSMTGVTGTTCRLNLSSESVEAGGNADQLRQVQDRHRRQLGSSTLPAVGVQLRLPGVERQMAERARGDHHVCSRLDRLLQGLHELPERRLLAGLDDREPAALDLRRVVDRVAPAGLDDRLERPRPVWILEAEDLRRTQDLAAVERRDLQAFEALVRDLLQLLVAVAVRDQPEQVLDLDRRRCTAALRRSRGSCSPARAARRRS